MSALEHKPEYSVESLAIAKKHLRDVKDKRDLHVIAIAVQVGAQFILTKNTAHFELLTNDIAVLEPKEFAEWLGL